MKIGVVKGNKSLFLVYKRIRNTYYAINLTTGEYTTFKKGQIRLRKRRRNTMKGVNHEVRIESPYERKLQALARGMHKRTFKDLQKFSDVQKIKKYIQDVKRNYNLNYGRIPEIQQQAIDAYHKEQFTKELNKVLGVNVASVVSSIPIEDISKKWIKENVSLIKTIPSTYFEKIEKIINKTPLDRQAIIKGIMKLGYSTERRATLIARDQTQKYIANLSEVRQTELGVDFYIWVTAGDDRVRPSHEEKNGQKIAWNNPPSDTGHAGEDIQCRCIAEPVLPKL